MGFPNKPVVVLSGGTVYSCVKQEGTRDDSSFQVLRHNKDNEERKCLLFTSTEMSVPINKSIC